MPGYESAMTIAVCLSKRITESGLSSEVHIPEENLTNEVCGYRALFAFISLEYVRYTPVEEPYA